MKTSFSLDGILSLDCKKEETEVITTNLNLFDYYEDDSDDPCLIISIEKDGIKKQIAIELPLCVCIQFKNALNCFIENQKFLMEHTHYINIINKKE